MWEYGSKSLESGFESESGLESAHHYLAHNLKLLQRLQHCGTAISTSLIIISFFYCSRRGVLVVSPSRHWYRPPVAGIALPSLVSPSYT